jgi:hypothetical protein
VGLIIPKAHENTNAKARFLMPCVLPSETINGDGGNKTKQMSNKTKTGSDQLGLFVDSTTKSTKPAAKSRPVGDLFTEVTEKQSRVNMDAAANTRKYKGKLIQTEDEAEQAEAKAEFIALAETCIKVEGRLATAIVKLQADGYSDDLIKAWLVEAGYEKQSAANKLSNIRIAKGNRQRSTGGGRKVKNGELVDRFCEFAALELGTGKWSVKDIECALHAAARYAKEGKIVAIEA